MGLRKGTYLVAAVAAVLTVAAGLGVRGVAAGDGAKYAGDALYTVLMHTLVVLLVPRIRPAAAALAAFAISCGVEFLQLSPWTAELAARSVIARLVLGSTFNAPDLFWYGVGAIVAWGAHTALVRLGGQLTRR